MTDYTDYMYVMHNWQIYADGRMFYFMGVPTIRYF